MTYNIHTHHTGVLCIYKCTYMFKQYNKWNKRVLALKNAILTKAQFDIVCIVLFNCLLRCITYSTKPYTQPKECILLQNSSLVKITKLLLKSPLTFLTPNWIWFHTHITQIIDYLIFKMANNICINIYQQTYIYMAL